MSKLFDSREVEYAYEVNSVLEPNKLINGFADGPNDANGNPTQIPTVNYQTKLTINYELRDAGKIYLGNKGVDHLSDLSASMLTADQVTQWVATNRDNFILADKLLLSGYTPPTNQEIFLCVF